MVLFSGCLAPRRLLRTPLAVLCAALVLLPRSAAADVPPTGSPPLLQRLAGARHDYTISFLWFSRVASGTMSLRREEGSGHYRALLEARTLGTAAWLTGNRVQRYATVMALSADGGRLRPLEHTSYIEKGAGRKRTVQSKEYLFDDRTRCVTVRRVKDGGASDETTLPLSCSTLPDDFLTAFYNFLLGVYGEIREGGEYRIPTLTRSGESTIDVRLLTSAEREGLDFFPAGGRLLKIVLDPEILDTGGGAVYARLDESGRVTHGIVENVLGLGDVKGVLSEGSRP